MNEITSFSKQFNWLSNFYPVKVVYDDVEYPTVEHAYVAAKTVDLDHRYIIRECGSPAIAKKLGKHLDLRFGWNDMKLIVMTKLLVQKFNPVGTPEQQNLSKKLIATGNAILIEGNIWGDCFWGVCNGRGDNWLGKILMQIRDNINGY